MRAIYLLFLLATLLFSYQKEITISNQKYKIIEDRYEEYGEKGTILNLYKVGSDKASLSFVVYEKSGECGKRDYQESIYRIDGSTITIYTKWSGYSVEGYRKMIYEVDERSSFRVISSYIYVIDRGSEDSFQEIKYLKNGAKNIYQQELLDEYISSIERSYKGRFLFGKDKDRLISELKSAFVEDMKNRWAR